LGVFIVTVNYESLLSANKSLQVGTILCNTIADDCLFDAAHPGIIIIII